MYLVHAIADWDWEMPGVALIALACATVAAGGSYECERYQFGRKVRVGVGFAIVLLSGATFVGWMGNTALAEARSELASGDVGGAKVAARRAEKWMPWSDQPQAWTGEALLAEGDSDAAARAYERALLIDNTYWGNWFGLARATRGQKSAAALVMTLRLNPLSIEVREYCDQRPTRPGCRSVVAGAVP